MKEHLARLWARYFVSRQQKWIREPKLTQARQMHHLIDRARLTDFGRAHRFSEIRSYTDFKDAVPLRNYESFSPYIEQILNGSMDVIWPGRPQYFALTSGTTQQTKYIPITKDSLRCQIATARAALLNYIYASGRTDFMSGRVLHYSASPKLKAERGFPTALLSGIVHHHLPFYVKNLRLPSMKINCIDDHLEKLEAIVKESHTKSVSLISGIPIWVQEYLDKLCEYTNKETVMEVFPQLALYMYGGTGLTPYRHRMMQRIGKEIPTIELYPASEGFFAYQDLPEYGAGLLLQLAHGMFFEFVPLAEALKPNPPRYDISEVKVGQPYALVVSSNAGLWGYMIGDVVSFTSLDPCRVRMVGRTGHYLSAFNEHLIADEVECAVAAAIERCPETRLLEYTVAPYISPNKGSSYHEWLIAFEVLPKDLDLFTSTLDEKIQEHNLFYRNLRQSRTLAPIRISVLQRDAFIKYMKEVGKLDPQRKVPRLSNDRKLADALRPHLLPAHSDVSS